MLKKRSSRRNRRRKRRRLEGCKKAEQWRKSVLRSVGRGGVEEIVRRLCEVKEKEEALGRV